ncbi:prevent-host-death protein [Nonomuraea phyllanthi]|uniref:Prevent-host-death protein n=1 Tax=Nonomuraea phyllanthi TaxID=2219224 RepID=A0A5C4WCC9_9ACTN|nr:prevent-host-death protein [Nonomuraea phyllanthi]KAB8193252.1 prevent-host-death protein [Nonomuraea phyllanthi]
MTFVLPEAGKCQPQEAEQRVSEAVRGAHDDMIEEYRPLSRSGQPDFKEFLLSVPDRPDDLELPRDKGLPREADLDG